MTFKEYKKDKYLSKKNTSLDLRNSDLTDLYGSTYTISVKDFYRLK